MSDDINFTNIDKSDNSDVVDNSIDLLISVPTNNVLTSYCNNANYNMLMTINEIAVSRNTQSLTSCHETVISYNTNSNPVLANTTSANINTPSDNMLASATPTKLADDVHTPSNKEEVLDQTHTLISFDKSHALNETSCANLPSGFLHKFMECAQLRHYDIASVINLSDYPLTVPQLRLLSRGLMFTPLPHSVDRWSLWESIAKFKRSLRLAEVFHETNNSDHDNRHNRLRPKSSWTPSSNRHKFLYSYISIITSEITNVPEHKSYENLSFEERSSLNDLKSNFNLIIGKADKWCSVVMMDRQSCFEEG